MSWLSKGLKKAERWVSNKIPHQHSADRRRANEAVAEQISYYQKAKDTMASAADFAEKQINRQKEMIAKKQIKSARRAYRAPGFMDEASSGYDDKLG